jgi:hypothetical protein
MFDDDLRFYRRTKSKRLVPMDEPEKIIDDMLFYLDTVGYASVGLGHRPFNNVKPNTEVAGIAAGAWALDRTILQAENIRIPQDFRIEEDTYLALALLTRGYQNILLHYLVLTSHGNPKTGCGAYRDANLRNEMNQLLADHFPPHVIQLTNKNGKIGKRINWRQFR